MGLFRKKEKVYGELRKLGIRRKACLLKKKILKRKKKRKMHEFVLNVNRRTRVYKNYMKEKVFTSYRIIHTAESRMKFFYFTFYF